MSYILDALKRAEADRARDSGAVPGLLALAAPFPSPSSSATLPWYQQRSVRALCSLLFAVSAALIWGLLATNKPDSPRPASTASSPSVVAAPQDTLSSAKAVPAPTQTPVSPPVPAALTVANPAALAPTTSKPEPAKSEPAATSGKSAPQVSAPATSGSLRVYAVAELPEDIRRDLPKLVVSGSVYSSNPAQRMLVLNGLVVQEGGTPHNDVVLEQIRPKSAVLLFKGYRYKLDF
jgi:general secretion pathway protein B